MATLLVTRTDGAERLALELPLDAAALSAPVVACGRDWRRLHGDDDAHGLRVRLAWSEPSPHLLHVTLLDATGIKRWQGLVSKTELSRLARRALRAGVAAGVVEAPREGVDAAREARYGVELAADDPVEAAPKVLDANPGAPTSRSRIGWKPRTSEPCAPALRFPELSGGEVVCSADAPELLLALSPDALATLRALADESGRTDQERAVLLFGQRRLVRDVPGAAEPIPCYQVQSSRVPAIAHASRTAVGFVPDALMPECGGQSLLGMAHTHLPGYGLWPSDPDLLDLDSLGAGAVSLILTGEAAAPGCLPPLSVFARAGWAGGEVKEAATCICVLAAHAETRRTS